mmetsp:Transcript_1943/g.6432  ORF Transcript_1943/g.6432 Transcript_1943/m.6432 type:complete len:286 (-) Transcript_1943:191-1048(-)
MRKARSPASSGAVHASESDAASTTAGASKRARASATLHASGGGSLDGSTCSHLPHSPHTLGALSASAWTRLVDRRRDALNGAVQREELEGGLRSDAGDVAGVVAAAEDAKVDEAAHRHVELLEQRRERHLADWPLDACAGRLGVEEVLEHHWSAKGEHVHVLRRGRVRPARLCNGGAGGLGLGRREHDGHAQQPEQLLHVGVHLRRHARGGALCLAGRLGVAGGERLFERRVRLLLLLLALGQLSRLERRRGTVKHVDGLDAKLEQLDRAGQEALDVRGHLSLRV